MKTRHLYHRTAFRVLTIVLGVWSLGSQAARCETSSEQLLKLINPGSPAVARPSSAFVTNLARITDPGIAPALRSAYAATNRVNDKFAVALALARLKDKSVGDYLGNPDRFRSRHRAALAAAALQHLGDESGRRWLETRLVHGRSQWAEPCVQAIMKFNLDSHKKTFLNIVKNKKAPLPWRHHCVAGLVQFAEPRAYAHADKLLSDSKEPADLIILLGKTGNRRVFPVLEKAFRRWRNYLPRAFMVAFSELGDTRALPLVRQIPAGAQPGVPSPATLTLAVLGDDAAVGKCINMLKKGVVNAGTMAAVKALGRSPSSALPPKLESLARGQSLAVQALVIQVLLLKTDAQSSKLMYSIVSSREKELRDKLVAEIIKRPSGSAVSILVDELKKTESGGKPQVAAALLAALQSRKTGKAYSRASDVF